MGILSSLHIADTVEQKSDFTAGRPWQQIVFQPTYLVALFGAITGYGIMILGMTATPIAMRHSHHELGSITTVIQLHVLGMFLPSFFTGHLIARFGVLKIMFAGLYYLPAISDLLSQNSVRIVCNLTHFIRCGMELFIYW